MVVNACVQYREEMFIGVGDINPDGQNFQIFFQFEQTKWRLVGHFELDPDDTSQDSWEDCNKCMCKISEQNIHWCWRYSSGRTTTDGRTAGRSPIYYNMYWVVNLLHRCLVYTKQIH